MVPKALRHARRRSMQARDRSPRVVVTGMGAVTPLGIGVDALWEGIQTSRSGEALMPEMDQFRMNTRIFGPVPAFDPVAAGLDPDFVERNDRYAWLAMLAAAEAIDRSGLLRGRLDRERVGVNMGTAVGGTGSMEQGFLRLTDEGRSPIDYARRPSRVYEYACPSSATAEIAARYRLMGPSATISTGCTSGIDAVGYAFHSIRAGDADAFVAGGADAPLVPIAVCAFDQIKAVTRKPAERVGTASTPFSAERDGFILAEAGAAVVLETLEHAVARDAPILAEITAFSSTSNAFHMTGMPAAGEDLGRAIEGALAQAARRPGEVHYLNAHGSSTPQNDRGEAAAYHGVFGKRARGIPVSSLKSQTGHALGAASAIEIISSVLAIQHHYLPPTINYAVPDPACDLYDFVVNEGRHHPVDLVITDASGFSGMHSAMVIEGYHG
jgi:3-oxoacyl-(acyl-carrier-protein) synthase